MNPGINSNILDVNGLTVRFGQQTVLRELTFAVPAGSTLAVIGPNGSGKTVLFRALIGAVPFEGEIRWAHGVRLGYVPQKLDLARDVPITGLDFLRARTSIDSWIGSPHQVLTEERLHELYDTRTAFHLHDRHEHNRP
jgi:ABC-type Mn2+/Zn2+ transport system ATPase subunit